jgi:hypothetical protein
MNKLLKLLDGNKTYATAVILAVYGVLTAFNIISITPDQEIAVFALIGSALGVSLRSAISK